MESIAGCIKSCLKKLELAGNGVDELGWTAEMTIRLGLHAGKILTYGPMPTMVFDPGATCVRPLNKSSASYRLVNQEKATNASLIVRAQRLTLRAWAARVSISSVLAPRSAIFGCLESRISHIKLAMAGYRLTLAFAML